MAEIDSLNVNDNSNVARFPEEMPPSAVNDGMRAVEGMLARWEKDTNGSLDALGTANAITLTAHRALTAYQDGLIMAFTVLNKNTGAVTLNVSELGAKQMRKHGDQPLVAGDLKDDQKCIVMYDATNGWWQVVSPTTPAPLGTAASHDVGTADGDIPELGTGGLLAVARIPNLNANKITAGTLAAARIPNLNANKITAGTLAAARIPNLNANKITAGTLAAARLPAINADRVDGKHISTSATGSDSNTIYFRT